jgi:hypothetical protein
MDPEYSTQIGMLDDGRLLLLNMNGPRKRRTGETASGRSGLSGRSRLSGQSGVCQYDALGGGPLRPLQSASSTKSTFAGAPFRPFASGCSELQPILLGFTDIVVEAVPEVL